MSVNIDRTVISLTASGARGQPSPPSSYVVVTQTGGTSIDWVLTPTTPLPNNAAEDVTFRFRPPNKAPGSLQATVVGVNDGDPWAVLGPAGEEIVDNVYTSADEIEFERGGVSSWTIKRLINPSLAKAGATNRDQFYASANSRIQAQAAFGK